MKHRIRRIVLTIFSLALLLTLCSGMGGKPLDADDMTAVSKVSISNKEVVSQNRPIIVTFSEAMVKPDAVDKPVPEKDMPFRISPALKGDGRWLTEKSFSFASSGGYPRGKQYFVIFKDNLQSLDKKPVRYFFSFRTQAVSVKNVWPNPYDEAKKEISLLMSFNLPVTAESLREHLTIRDAASDETLEYNLRDMQRDASEHEILIRTDALRPKLALSIALDGDSDRTSLGFAKAYEATVNITPLSARVLPDPGSRQAVQRSDTPSDLHFYNPYTSEYDGSMHAYFRLSDDIQLQDAERFITVTPDLPYTVDSGSRLVFAKGVEPGMKITVKLLPGLVDEHGRVLKEARSSSLTVPDRSPLIAFSDNGNYLTPAFGGRLGLRLLNLDRVDVSLSRQYDNNLPFMSLESEADNLARHIAYRSYDLRLEKNKETTRALDLESLADGQQGVFLLNVTGYKKMTDRRGKEYYSHYTNAARVVVLSDIGITSRLFPSGATVFVSRLSTGKPLPNADVRMYSASNQLIVSGKTGGDGLLTLKRENGWDPQLRPHVVTVQSGTDITFLPYDYQTAVSLPDDAQREYLDKGYEAFLYTPRGVFRPGETVDVKAFVRDAAHQPPTPFPVLFTVVSSRGLEAARSSSMLSAQGGANAAVVLPASAPTGEYTVELTIPGQSGRLGGMTFSVEDFVPPKLEVEVEAKAEHFIADNPLPVALSGQYLFGAPGADLNYEIGYRVGPHVFSPQGWEGYYFGNAELSFAAQSALKYITGSLASDGRVRAEMRSPGWKPAAAAYVQVVGSVQDDGGRWVTQTDSAIYFPTPWLLGLKTDGPIAAGQKNSIKVAAVNPDGKLVESAGTLKAEVFYVRGNWHTVYRDGRYVYTWSEQLLPVLSESLPTQKGEALLDFTPKEYGRYLVRCSSEDGTIVAARRYGVWGSEGEAMQDGSGRMDQVELSLDKKEYKIGETALLSVKAPYAGTLLLGLEKGEQLSTRVVELQTPATVLEIPVTRDMDPNVAITVWVYRPISEADKEWYAHRAYGKTSIALSKAAHTLKVVAVAPERAEPSKGLTIPFTVTDVQGKPAAGEFSVALVDEGILSLTAFKTPDPVRFFMEARRSTGRSYDGFDQLLRPEAKAVQLLLPGGDGVVEEDYQGSLSTEQIFLAGFVPTVVTDAEGKGEVFFDIPEYSGKGRLMIVGAASDNFASAADNVRFARDVVMEVAAPRAVAPGDVFDISLKVFALKDKEKKIAEGPGTPGASPAVPADGASAAAPAAPHTPTKPAPQSAEVSVSVNDYLDLAGKLTNTVHFAGNDASGDADGAKTVSYTIRATAQKKAGVAKIAVDVKVPGRDDIAFTKYLDVVVRPPYPRSSQTKTALIKAGGTETISVPEKWIKGTVKSSLSINKSPIFSVLPALDYLRDYPYGCLEQTVSCAWPYLTLAEVQAALYPEEAASEAGNTNVILQYAVSRIASMQTGDGGFSMWPGSGRSDPWKSVHATFFLHEAKAKVAVAKRTLDMSRDYLRFLLAVPDGYFDSQTYAYTTKAYAAFVMARTGNAPLSWMQHLSGRQDKMLPSGRIFLAGAKALHAGNPKALLDLKEADLKLNTQKLGYNSSLESELRNQALLLMIWSMVAPDHPETTKRCLVLAEALNKRSWFTTQDAGMASLAFGLYLSKVDMGDSAYTAEVSAAGKILATVKNGDPLLIGNAGMPLSADGNPEPLRVKVGGDKAQAYITYNVRGVSFSAPPEAAEDMQLLQTWKNASGKTVDFTDGTAKLKKGDRVTVEVTLRATRPVSDVVLSLLLPGGLEVENPRLATSGADQPARLPEDSNTGADDGEDGDENNYTGERYNDYPGGFYTDMREDRLLLFFDRLSGGNSPITYSFTMRAVSSGTFVVPPPAAEGMYNPAMFATGKAAKVVIE